MLEDALCEADCAIFLVDHDYFKRISLKEATKIMSNPVIIDCKNLFEENGEIIYLGIGKGRGFERTV
jgi:UDP-N-acetyl-D-glucosamine dehydrogenase